MVQQVVREPAALLQEEGVGKRGGHDEGPAAARRAGEPPAQRPESHLCDHLVGVVGQRGVEHAVGDELAFQAPVSGLEFDLSSSINQSFGMEHQKAKNLFGGRPQRLRRILIIDLSDFEFLQELIGRPSMECTENICGCNTIQKQIKEAALMIGKKLTIFSDSCENDVSSWMIIPTTDVVDLGKPVPLNVLPRISKSTKFYNKHNIWTEKHRFSRGAF